MGWGGKPTHLPCFSDDGGWLESLEASRWMVCEMRGLLRVAIVRLLSYIFLLESRSASWPRSFNFQVGVGVCPRFCLFFRLLNLRLPRILLLFPLALPRTWRRSYEAKWDGSINLRVFPAAQTNIIRISCLPTWMAHCSTTFRYAFDALRKCTSPVFLFLLLSISSYASSTRILACVPDTRV